jgi:hypothetical protein
MSTDHATVAETEQHLADDVEPEHHSDGYYIKIALIMVVMIFMHLRDEKPIYRYLFYSGLFLAIGVYTGALAAFHFFG